MTSAARDTGNRDEPDRPLSADRHWRVGEHYKIHVYEGTRPVATFHHESDARRCVDIVNRAAAAERRLNAVRELAKDTPTQMTVEHEFDHDRGVLVAHAVCQPGSVLTSDILAVFDTTQEASDG